MFSLHGNNRPMRIKMQRTIREIKIFLSTPLEVHLCILVLLIKLSRKSSKDSDGLK